MARIETKNLCYTRMADFQFWKRLLAGRQRVACALRRRFKLRDENVSTRRVFCERRGDYANSIATRVEAEDMPSGRRIFQWLVL